MRYHVTSGDGSERRFGFRVFSVCLRITCRAYREPREDVALPVGPPHRQWRHQSRVPTGRATLARQTLCTSRPRDT